MSSLNELYKGALQNGSPKSILLQTIIFFFVCSVEHIWKEFWSNTTMSLGAKDSSMIGHNKENQEVSSTSEEQKIKLVSLDLLHLAWLLWQILVYIKSDLC